MQTRPFSGASWSSCPTAICTPAARWAPSSLLALIPSSCPTFALPLALALKEPAGACSCADEWPVSSRLLARISPSRASRWLYFLLSWVSSAQKFSLLSLHGDLKLNNRGHSQGECMTDSFSTLSSYPLKSRMEAQPMSRSWVLDRERAVLGLMHCWGSLIPTSH